MNLWKKQQRMFVQIEQNVIKLYGSIYWGDGQYITSEIAPVLKKYDEVTVHLHTPGGSVFDGNLIYTALQNSTAKIHIIIDGLAASMGSILMLAGNKISIASNAYVMVHAPSGTAQGNHTAMTSTAKLLQSMEKTFLAKYAKRTSKDTEDLKSWMDGDNWFSAEQALDEGLVDEIIEANEELEPVAYHEMSLVALMDQFKMQQLPTTIPKNVVTTKIDTMKKDVISALGLSGVDDKSSDTAVISAIQSQLSGKDDAMSEKDNEISRLNALIKENDKKAITAAVSSAIAQGKTTEANRAKYEALGEKIGVEELSSILADLTGKPATITSKINSQSGGSTSAHEGKSWKELSKISGALEKLRNDDLEAFKALYQEEFGTEYKS